MSSSEETDLKAGHPPAVKAGGKRIIQHKPPQEKERTEKNNKLSDESEESEEEEEVKSTSPPKQQLLISGAPARGDADFPTQAVQAIHVKPMPSHEFRASSSKPSIIHQPRK